MSENCRIRLKVMANQTITKWPPQKPCIQLGKGGSFGQFVWPWLDRLAWEIQFKTNRHFSGEYQRGQAGKIISNLEYLAFNLFTFFYVSSKQSNCNPSI